MLYGNNMFPGFLFKDILDKRIFGYLCQITTPLNFYQDIACISLKGTSRGLKALQSNMNDSYHKSVYVKGTMGDIRYDRN